MTKKLYILSDLHIEAASIALPNQLEFDILILAGDTHVHTEGLYWARDNFPNKTIVYVPGNHEFYDSNYNRMLSKMRSVSSKLGIHFLYDATVEIDNIILYGTTLWTDFKIMGPDKQKEAMNYAEKGMYDYAFIEYEQKKLLKPEDTVNLHRISRQWLCNELKKHKNMLNVVITHHAPHKNSIHKRFKDDILSTAFASDLENLIKEYSPSLWIHGHSHDVFDYYIHNTRVVCNPRGYANESVNFNNKLIIEV